MHGSNRTSEETPFVVGSAQYNTQHYKRLRREWRRRSSMERFRLGQRQREDGHARDTVHKSITDHPSTESPSDGHASPLDRTQKTEIDIPFFEKVAGQTRTGRGRCSSRRTGETCRESPRVTRKDISAAYARVSVLLFCSGGCPTLSVNDAINKKERNEERWINHREKSSDTNQIHSLIRR